MNKCRNLILVAMFAALTAIGAFIRIPIPNVPFTLQYLFCALSGIVLGSKLGALSQIVYVGIGLLGLPVFTQGGGIGYVFSPTFGYLIGFIIAAYIIGKIRENIKEWKFSSAILTLFAGLLFIYLLGVSYLYVIYNFYLGKSVGVYFAVFYGFLTCIGGDVVLTIIIAYISIKLLPALKKNGYIK